MAVNLNLLKKNQDDDDENSENPEQDKPKKEKKDNLEEVQNLLTDEYDFVFNEITREIIFKEKGSTVFSPFYDENFSDLYIDLKKRKFKISKDLLHTLIESKYVSFRKNEIYDYFNALKPIPDENEMKALCATLKQTGQTNFDQFYILFRRWLIGCYYCGMGFSANHVCLVLVGGQGIYKSTWLDKLCPPALSDYGVRTKLELSAGNKDTQNLLVEKFLINIDDQLAGLFRKDAEAIKTFITAEKVEVRKAYTRSNVKRNRIANFVASVNETNFLSDNENRRYLITEVSLCDIFAKIDINKVWSEVKFLATNKKEQGYFTADEANAQKLINEYYVENTLESEWLFQIYRPAIKDDSESQIKYLGANEIIKELNYHSKVILNPYKVNQAMKRYKFYQVTKRLPDVGPRKVYPVVLRTEDRIPDSF